MKKKVIIGIISVLVVISGCLFVMFNSSNKSYYVITNNNEEKIMNTNALTMMYETEAGSGEYQVTSDTTWPQEGYVFNETLSACENGSELSWDDENNRVIMEANTSDKCYVYFDIPTLADVCPNGGNLSSCIQTYYTTYGEGAGGLYYHDGTGSYTNADQEAGDNSYRYAGANPNNPNDNLYRIIGVFEGEVKLIKADFANSNLLGTDGNYSTNTDSASSHPNYSGSLTTINLYNWDKETSNIWSESNLNTINLNQNYLNNIGSEWSDKITEHTWQVGGASSANVSGRPVQTAYNYEVGANTANKTYDAKIGLMYVSDYGYATDPSNWRTDLGDYNNAAPKSSNWMYMAVGDWTISRNSSFSSFAWTVRSGGDVDDSVTSNTTGVRPSFYLESSVTYAGGTGSARDPILLSV